MKLFLSIVLIVTLSAIAAHFLPWWIIAVVSFVVSLMMAIKPDKAFLAGFLGVAVFWLIAVLLKDIPNEHILSWRMAALFHLPNYILFIIVTVFVGSLIGGLAAWSGALFRYRGK
jgi:hypothetical protein